MGFRGPRARPLSSAAQRAIEEAQELWLGPSGPGSRFASKDDARAAWERHRDRVMARWGRHGRRPQGWWEFEGPIPRPPYDREQSTLWAAGLLAEGERVELEVFWRGQFERAWRPHFFFCDGPGIIFEGAVARRKHYAWADIPQQLIEEWTRERRHRESATKETTAKEQQPPLERADAAVLVGTVEPHVPRSPS